MLLFSSPIPTIPTICVSPASPLQEKSYPEYHPPVSSITPDENDDDYRANFLSVPPSANTSPWHPSPLRPVICPPRKGLARDKFDSLLRASREKRATLKGQKVPDLRKQLALKNQGHKQAERRALFLSKVKEVPSTLIDCAIESHTDSPSIVLPPNGIGSPFHMLGSVKQIDSPVVDGEVEHILPITAQLPAVAKADLLLPTRARKSRRGSPSLEEIIARMKPTTTAERSTSRSRLPSSLKSFNSPPGNAHIKDIPVRILTVNDEKFDISPLTGNAPDSSLSSKAGLTTPVAPLSVKITLGSLNQSPHRAGRAVAAQDMITTLKRRNHSPPGLRDNLRAKTSPELKRCSAPATVQGGRNHASLSLGAF